MAVVREPIPREKSEIATKYTDPDAGSPYTIYFDQWMTRRKRFHVITDCAGGVVFRSRWVSDIFDWLDAREIREYTASIDGNPWRVALEPIGRAKE